MGHDHFFQIGTIKLVPDAMSAAEVLDICAKMADMGFNQVIFNMPNVQEIKPLEVIGQEVIPQLQK